MAFQTNAFCQTNTAQPRITNVEENQVKEVTIPQFLKHLTAMHQTANGEELNVAFFGKVMDSLVIAYNGENNKEIEQALNLPSMHSGDIGIIEPKKKSETLAAQSFRIKK